jgi:hypothetical protein
MATCTICRFETELDDVVVGGRTGWCVCLRCFARETDNGRPMPKGLRRELSAALAQIEVG